jgi:BlaI family penicillinase repressor
LNVKLTDRELNIMTVLWEAGPSTVAEVQRRLEAPLAHNTVLTMLTILEGKGYVGHTVEGRAHRFHPLVDREAAGSSVLERVTEKLFGGSAELLLTHLVRDRRRVGDDEIRRMRRLLDERLGETPPEEES